MIGMIAGDWLARKKAPLPDPLHKGEGAEQGVWQWACYLATYVGLLAIYLANEDITANSTAGLGPFLMLPIVCLVMFAGGAFGIYLGQKRHP